MSSSFAATVSALAEAIIRERCAHIYRGGENAHEPVARFLLETHARMPDHLRLPFMGLTLVFDLWPLPFAGRVFHGLPHADRWRQILAWRASSLGFRRDLIKFYETLVVFGWYAEIYGEDYTNDIAA